jgi:hypothetical protein
LEKRKSLAPSGTEEAVSSKTEYGSNGFLQNAGTYLPDCMVFTSHKSVILISLINVAHSTSYQLTVHADYTYSNSILVTPMQHEL